MCTVSPNEVESAWNWSCHRVSGGWHEKSSWSYFEWCKRAWPTSRGIREVSTPRYELIVVRILQWKSAIAATESLPVYRARKRNSGLESVLASAACRNE